MSNSYGFDGDFPQGLPWGLYSVKNGEWTGIFYETEEEGLDDLARRQERDGFDDDTYSIEAVEEEEEEAICRRCGERIELSLLHPDSLPIPESGDWYATHGPTICGGDDDLGTWIVEGC